MHIFRLLLFLCISLHCASAAFSADNTIWTAEDPKPWNFSLSWKRLQNTPEQIEMKPRQLYPEGTFDSAIRPSLMRFLGPIAKGISGAAGIAFMVSDLEDGRKAVAYAIDKLVLRPRN